LNVLLYDNTPGARRPADLPESVLFHQASRNVGLAEAYNFALDIGEAAGCSWLLTLDQDTSLPNGILRRMTTLAQQFSEDPSVAGIVPQLVEQGVVQSPLYVQRWGSRRLPLGYSGFPEREITAMNSCSMWSIPHLRAIGNFDQNFWLDYLDYVLYHRTFRSGRRVYVSGDIRVEHQLSLADWKGRLSPERLQNIFLAESAFNDLYKGSLDRLLANLKLLLLLLKRKYKAEQPEFLRVIRAELIRRLLKSRRLRLATWRHLAELRGRKDL